MADTNLTMTATVVDAFSRPLAKLRQDLEATAKTRALPDMAKGWQSLRGEVGAFSREIQSQALPSMAAFSLRGAAIGTALTTAAVAMRGFSSDVKGVTVLSREMGFQSADSLLKLQNLGKRAGMEFQETQQSLLTFSRSMDQIKRRWGDVYNGLRQTPIGAEIAEQLVKASSLEDAVEIAIREIRKIQNPVKQREIAQAIFGTEMWARVANEATPKVMAEINRLSAHIDQKTQEAASKFESNLSRMSEAAQKLKIEAMGPLLELSVKLWDQLEKPVGDAFAAFSKDMVAALPKINEGFGQLKTIWEGLASVDFSKNIEAIKQLEKLTEIPGIGKMVQGFREGGSTDTGLGSIANKALEATKEFLGVKQPEGTAVKTPDGRPFVAPGLQTPGKSNDLLKAQEKLTSATEKLNDTLSSAAGGSQGAMPGVGTGLGALGGMIGGGISSAWGAVKSAFGGGGGGGGAAGAGAGGGGGGGGGGGAQVSRFGGKTGAAPANTKSVMQAAIEQLRKEGVPEANLKVAAAHLTGQAISESGLNANATHDQGTGAGIYGARDDPKPGGDQRRTKMFNWLKQNNLQPTAENQMRYMAHEAMTEPRFGKTRETLMKASMGTAAADIDTITRNFEAPAVTNNRAPGFQQAIGSIGGSVPTGPHDAAGNPHVATSPASPEEIKRNLPSLQAALGLTRGAGLEITSDLRRGGATSMHGHARAYDVRARTPEAADAAMAKMRETYAKAGLKEGEDYNFLDETRRRTRNWTGPHVHVSLTESGIAKLKPTEAEKPKPGAALKESTNYQAKENAKAAAKETPPGKLTAEGVVQVTLSDSLAEKNASVKTSGMFKEANIKRERLRVA
jgi:hypothetical protein